MAAIDESDCVELLRHTYAQMRELGMADLAERMIEAAPLDPEHPSRQLLHLLDGLAAEMRLQDGDTARAVVQRLRRVARTHRGRRPDGLWLELAPAHEQVYGPARVDLTESHDMAPLIEQLETLAAEVRESLRGPR